MIKYYRLFDILNRREIKKTELLEIMSSPTLAKLGKGEIVKTDIIDKICEFLQCQPGDIMEYVEETPIYSEDGEYQGIVQIIPELDGNADMKEIRKKLPKEAYDKKK